MRSDPGTSGLEAPADLRPVLAALMMVILLGALDQNIVNTALPRIADALGGLPHLSWVVLAFLLTGTVSTPLYGKLGDIRGRRPVLLVSIGLFLLASALCGAATSMTQLIACRALQGLGAGGLITLAQAAIGDIAGPRGRGRYQGLFTAAIAVGTVAGPVVGGLLTTLLSWRWLFLVNLPIGLVAGFLIHRHLPHVPAKPHRIDVPGAVLLVAAALPGLVLLSWGGSVIPWRSALAAGLALSAVTLGGAFLLQERRAREPLVDLAMFRSREFAIAVAASTCMTFAMNATMVFMPLYLQTVLALDPTRAGLMMVPQIGAMIVTSVVAGRLSSRTGRVTRYMMLGVACEALALALCALFAWRGAPVPAFLTALGILGFGMGMGMPNTVVVIQNAVPRNRLGVATATMSFLRSFGGLMGVALSGNVMASRLAAETTGYQNAIAASFTVGAAVMGLAVVLVRHLGPVRLGEEVPIGSPLRESNQ
jgi:EmrB/QacA subfamily drug resistance transporter